MAQFQTEGYCSLIAHGICGNIRIVWNVNEFGFSRYTNLFTTSPSLQLRKHHNTHSCVYKIIFMLERARSDGADAWFGAGYTLPPLSSSSSNNNRITRSTQHTIASPAKLSMESHAMNSVCWKRISHYIIACVNVNAGMYVATVCLYLSHRDIVNGQTALTNHSEWSRVKHRKQRKLYDFAPNGSPSNVWRSRVPS